MAKIVLIACSKTKLSHEAKARDLYQGDLFKKSLEYSESVLKPEKIFILSAKYELLGLNRKIKPYERTLNKMKKAKRTIWANNVIGQLRRVANIKKDRFIFLASAKYREYILPHIANFEVPMKGLSQGNQLKYLKMRLQK